MIPRWTRNARHTAIEKTSDGSSTRWPGRYTIIGFTISMTVAVKNNNKAPLVVPPAVRRRAGFRSGQEIEFRVSGGVITILPKLPAADDEYTLAQRRAIDARLARADDDI